MTGEVPQSLLVPLSQSAQRWSVANAKSSITEWISVAPATATVKTFFPAVSARLRTMDRPTDRPTPALGLSAEL